MIKRVVMWRIEGVAEEEKRSIAQKIKARIETLPALVGQIRSYHVGLNINTTASACDLVLVSDYDSVQDLAAYTDSPAHQEVVQFLRSFNLQHWTVDYEY